MKTRSEIKKQAKAVLSAKWGKCVLIAFLCMFVISAGAVIVPGAGILLLLPVVSGMYLTYSLLMNGENADIGTMFTCAFQGNFGRKLAGMLLTVLYIALWSLLFVIPGIVKTYSYAMTPYILAKYPNVPAQEAITLSRRIMKGNKWKLFVVHLSFIGWALLGTITFGITLILHTEPYMYLTYAGCYEAYLNDALEKGRITEAGLKINA